jgi:hypothetical protein
VVLQIPQWCAFLPAASIESVGSGVLQGVLNLMVPRFLGQLQVPAAGGSVGEACRGWLGEGMGWPVGWSVA